MHSGDSELCCLGGRQGRGHGSGAGGRRCGGHGPRTPKLKASLAAAIYFTVPGLASPKEGSLSIAPNHSGEPGLVILPGTRGSHGCLYMQERIVKIMGDYQVMDEFLYNLSTEDFNGK